MNTENILDKLGELPINGQWIWLHTNRYGKELMTDFVKWRIDLYGDLEINEEYTKFRRIESCKEMLERLGHPTGAVAVMEFRDISEVTFDYSHLPEPKIKTISSKEWEKKKGRQ